MMGFDQDVPAKVRLSVSGGGITIDTTDIVLQAHFSFPAPKLLFTSTIGRFRHVALAHSSVTVVTEYTP